MKRHPHYLMMVVNGSSKSSFELEYYITYTVSLLSPNSPFSKPPKNVAMLSQASRTPFCE